MIEVARPTFELRHLRYFVAAAEELHFTRAAKRLNIAQPPLSQQIRQLETIVGTALFIRANRRVRLTPAGAAFLETARLILLDAERGAEAARRVARGELGTLRVGFADSAALSVLPQIIRKFQRLHPDVHLELTESPTQLQLDALAAHRIDVAMVRGPIASHSFAVDVLLREKFVAALPADHSLAGRTRLSLKALSQYPIVLFPRHLAPGFYDSIIAMVGAEGGEVRVGYEAGEYQTILSLVAAGLGISVVPESVKNLGRTGVRFRPLTASKTKAEVVAVHLPGTVNTALAAWLSVARGEASGKEQRSSRRS